jgi:hypothetical protein
MIDSVSNDFHSEVRCPTCEWYCTSTLHKHAAYLLSRGSSGDCRVVSGCQNAFRLFTF